MGELSEFERKRIDSASDNKEVSVRDLLRFAIDEIDKGQINPSSCVIVFADKSEAGDVIDLYYFRSNVKRIEEVAYLEMAKYSAARHLLSDSD